MMPATRLAAISILVGLAVLGLKLVAWAVTGSVALLSDALESIVNVAAACAALIAVHVAARPADARHPWGRGKAEYVSAVVEGALILLAAILILEAAVIALAEGPVPPPDLIGLAWTAAATALNGAWALVLLRQGRQLRSPALRADGVHLMADVATSVGVAGGVVLAALTGWWMLDPLIALAVAVHILWSGAHVLRGSLGDLMDAAVPEDEMQAIREAIAAAAGGASEAHDIRTRRAGAETFIDFHLVIPGETSVFDAHEICDRVEAALRGAVPGARVTIHVEPEHKSHGSGVLVID
ncbi:cation diffusion facilitator family transporter [Jannaschia formosa]|uniref:cation diffusion facilitator family transporter n=1 Tax=Jannaschia formosa TaxID=2259592 RepID=UPI000E1B8751|nr:cation diffusion facilitator family transporter [Jannaschia formosa]TFL19740.1 cation transporter [Jannaschia formosa]